MTGGRRKEITYHLSEKKIDELLREATDDRRKERLEFLKNLYYGDLVAEAADREGRSAATGRRWADAWNEGGLEGLMPSFGGGQRLKFNEAISELNAQLNAEAHNRINSMDRDYAMVVIAHRPSTVKQADDIHVMEDGQIIETGTRWDLVSQDGTYTSLYATQTQQ